MLPSDPRWAGIDVGARRKGFHCAAIDRFGVVAAPTNLKPIDDVVLWLRNLAPAVVGLDSPCAAAAEGRTCRDGEQALARSVCGIRWTPDSRCLEDNPYYEWVRNGLALYEALAKASRKMGWTVIEVFPTASWTRWAGPRGGATRAAWTSRALTSLSLTGLPAGRLNQDGRDAIAAALTAKLYAENRCESFGDIVVPISRPDCRRGSVPELNGCG